MYIFFLIGIVSCVYKFDIKYENGENCNKDIQYFLGRSKKCDILGTSYNCSNDYLHEYVYDDPLYCKILKDTNIIELNKCHNNIMIRCSTLEDLKI